MIISKLRQIVEREIQEEKKRSFYENKNIILGLNPVIGDECIIGEYTYIGDYTHINVSTIGRYTSIGNNCAIGPGEHRIKRCSTSYRIYKDKYGAEYYDGDDDKLAGGVAIGNDVWIGCNAVVRRGVSIGNGAVIGANSFVNKDIPAYAIAVGTPAKIIGYRFDDETIRYIQHTVWWEKDLEEARDIISKLEDKLGIQSFQGGGFYNDN